MIYTGKRMKLIAKQMSKFSDADTWIVAGQFANIDFWLNEVKTALKGVDEHNSRFDKMYATQNEYIEFHKIHIPDNCPICKGICDYGPGSLKPRLPRRSAETKADKKESRKELIDSTYYYLLRCYKLKLHNEKEFRHRCEEIGTSIDFKDLNCQ